MRKSRPTRRVPSAAPATDTPARSFSIANLHPRLKLPGKALQRAFTLLDQAFSYRPADLPHLDRPARARIRASRAGANRAAVACVPPGEISLVFMTDTALAELHGRFLDDPSTTDVITFNGSAEAGTAGEICVSVDTAERYARSHRRSFAEELTLYLVHGWLHLAGYDDLRPLRKRRMRAAEKRAMDLLGKADALPAFALR